MLDDVVACAVTPVGIAGPAGVIGTDFVSLMPQRFAAYAVACSATVPDPPAVKVIDATLVALVIVPPVMVQAYVAPANGFAVTDATLPIEFATTLAGAVIDIVNAP